MSDVVWTGMSDSTPSISFSDQICKDVVEQSVLVEHLFGIFTKACHRWMNKMKKPWETVSTLKKKKRKKGHYVSPLKSTWSD